MENEWIYVWIKRKRQSQRQIGKHLGWGALRDTFWSFILLTDQVPSLSASPGCDNVGVQPCMLKRPGTVCLAWQDINLPECLVLLPLCLSLSEKASQFFGDTSLVGVRISVGGHRSVGGGSDKLWNVKDQFLPHVSAVGEHSQAVS